MTTTGKFYLYVSDPGKIASQRTIYIWAKSSAEAVRYWASRRDGGQRQFRLARGTGIPGAETGVDFATAITSTFAPVAR